VENGRPRPGKGTTFSRAETMLYILVIPSRSQARVRAESGEESAFLRYDAFAVFEACRTILCGSVAWGRTSRPPRPSAFQSPLCHPEEARSFAREGLPTKDLCISLRHDFLCGLTSRPRRQRVVWGRTSRPPRPSAARRPGTHPFRALCKKVG